MSDYAPVLLAILFVFVAFAFAANKGVVGLLASGGAAAVAAATVLAGFEYLPALAKDYLDITLPWRFTLGALGAIALVGSLVLRIVLAIVLKQAFNPDSWLHGLSDGFVGGLLSIGPSLVAVFIFFTCLRAAGTLQELNYVHSLAREGIREMGGRIPKYPLSARWRNAIESLPFLAQALDATDPFSRRAARNAAALALASRGVEVNNHLRVRHETGEVADSPRWLQLSLEPAVAEAIETLDRVGLVVSEPVRKVAADAAFTKDLQTLELQPALESFVASLAKAAPAKGGSESGFEEIAPAPLPGTPGPASQP